DVVLDTKIGYTNDVRVVDGCGKDSLLIKANQEVRIAVDEARQNYFDRVSGFEEFMLCTENNAHAALSEPALKDVAAADRRAAVERGRRRSIVQRTDGNVILVTGTAFNTLFH